MTCFCWPSQSDIIAWVIATLYTSVPPCACSVCVYVCVCVFNLSWKLCLATGVWCEPMDGWGVMVGQRWVGWVGWVAGRRDLRTVGLP